MADAPSGGSGSGWGALEVILALILGIGLITTLTGGTIQPLFGTATTGKKTVATGTAKTTAPTGCGIVVSRPKTKEKVTTEVAVAGSFPECITAANIPTTINAQVVDSTGTPLSVYTSIPINKGFFGLGGGSTFNATIPLVGVAHSTSGYLILSAPTQADGSVLSTRVAIQFATGTTSNATNAGQPTYIPNTTTTGGSYFVPSTTYPSNTSGQTTTTTTTNTNTQTTAPTYTPPATTTGSGSGSGSNTF
ncbi:MAG: hypothetical protein ABIO57_03880 [Candidatus Paceibacterota bacterium]